ncbi:MAG TPA: hypothetical protein PK689_07240, partial [Kiritimatiellia bacterium]|nr:hypothetical protein [Kiritimatiellia bacterium]
RARDVEQMFADGEQIFKAKVKARQERGRSFAGFWMELAQDLLDRFAPALARANRVAGAGPYPGGPDPRDILDRYGLREVTTYRWLRRLYETVVQPLEARGLTLEDLGKVLFWERIAAGDRSVVANPLGHDPDAARAALMHWRLHHGLGDWTLLKDAVARFHDLVFETIRQAVDVGAYNRDVFNNRLAPNKDYYASFAVLDYLEDYLPPGIRQQIGTFKRVANPFLATVLKTISLQNLIAWQEAKNAVVRMLQTHFPEEIEPAKMRGAYPHLEPAPPPPDRGLLMRLEDGRPKWYYVDPYIARAFEEVQPGHLRRVLKLLDYGFRSIFYPLYITYSAGFMLAMSPLRDYQRTAQNLLGRKFNRLRLWIDYLKTFSDARSRFYGQASPLIREMEANFALGTPYDTFSGLWRDDAFAEILRRFHFLPNEEARGLWDKFVFAPIHRALAPVEAVGELLDAKLRAVTGWNVRPVHAMLHPLDTVEFYGMILDTLPKTASYRILRRRGLTPAQAAQWVRNNAGLPAVHRKGLAVETVRALLPFWNVFIQGWRADAKLATAPKTRAGWWLRWALQDGWLAMLQGLAAGGMLGAALKELFDGISEYRKTNYQVLPLGFVAGGEFGKRVA